MYIITIIGSSGSGKSTIGKLVSKRLKADYVEISDLVKTIANVENKNDMRKLHMEGKNAPKTKAIFDAILDRIKAMKSHVLIISGIRETNLFLLLAKTFAHVIPFLLVADYTVRQQRLNIKKEELMKLDRADLQLGFGSFIQGFPKIERIYDTTKLTPEQVAGLIANDTHAIASYEGRKW